MDELNKVLDRIEGLIREAKEVCCQYVGIFILNELLEECGRKVEDDDYEEVRKILPEE